MGRSISLPELILHVDPQSELLVYFHEVSLLECIYSYWELAFWMILISLHLILVLADKNKRIIISIPLQSLTQTLNYPGKVPTSYFLPKKKPKTWIFAYQFLSKVQTTLTLVYIQVLLLLAIGMEGLNCDILTLEINKWNTKLAWINVTFNTRRSRDVTLSIRDPLRGTSSRAADKSLHGLHSLSVSSVCTGKLFCASM
jgi:hypothetical protein